MRWIRTRITRHGCIKKTDGAQISQWLFTTVHHEEFEAYGPPRQSGKGAKPSGQTNTQKRPPGGREGGAGRGRQRHGLGNGNAHQKATGPKKTKEGT